MERVLAENEDDMYVDYAGGDNEGKDEWVSLKNGKKKKLILIKRQGIKIVFVSETFKNLKHNLF